MTPGPRADGGLPRRQQQIVVPLGSRSSVEDWRGASEAKTEKLRRNDVQRRVRARGLQLRHSAYGYALIDTERRAVDDRNDLTLDEVESWLDRPLDR
jgi:hypothetical protein